MAEKPARIVFELNREATALNIHLNRAGGYSLISRIAKTGVAHDDNPDHLMTPAWGGHEPAGQPLYKQNRVIHQVNIYVWGDALWPGGDSAE